MKEKYILVQWPEIQKFEERPDYRERVYAGYDHNVDDCAIWFVPEDMYYEVITLN